MCLLVLLKGKFLCLFLVLVLCRGLVLWPCTSLGPCTLAWYFCRGRDLGGLLRRGRAASSPLTPRAADSSHPSPTNRRRSRVTVGASCVPVLRVHGMDNPQPHYRTLRLSRCVRLERFQNLLDRRRPCNPPTCQSQVPRFTRFLIAHNTSCAKSHTSHHATLTRCGLRCGAGRLQTSTAALALSSFLTLPVCRLHPGSDHLWPLLAARSLAQRTCAVCLALHMPQKALALSLLADRPPVFGEDPRSSNRSVAIDTCWRVASSSRFRSLRPLLRPYLPRSLRLITDPRSINHTGIMAEAARRSMSARAAHEVEARSRSSARAAAARGYARARLGLDRCLLRWRRLLPLRRRLLRLAFRSLTFAFLLPRFSSRWLRRRLPFVIHDRRDGLLSPNTGRPKRRQYRLQLLFTQKHRRRQLSRQSMQRRYHRQHTNAHAMNCLRMFVKAIKQVRIQRRVRHRIKIAARMVVGTLDREELSHAEDQPVRRMFRELE